MVTAKSIGSKLNIDEVIVGGRSRNKIRVRLRFSRTSSSKPFIIVLPPENNGKERATAQLMLIECLLVMEMLVRLQS
jgi:hypothetical protein